MSLALMEGIIGGQCRAKRGNIDNAKLISEEAVLIAEKQIKLRDQFGFK